MPLVVGVCGGIASSKSTVSQLLGELGARVIDADKLGHACYEPGHPCVSEMAAAFGPDIIDVDGRVDRKKLGPKVFASEEAMQTLNETVWPHIRRALEAAIADARAAGPPDRPEELCVEVVCVEAAIMLSAGWQDLMDEVIVTTIEPNVALPRLLQRNPNLTPEAARERMQKTAIRDAMIAEHAHHVITNNEGLDELKDQVVAYWGRRGQYAQEKSRRQLHRFLGVGMIIGIAALIVIQIAKGRASRR